MDVFRPSKIAMVIVALSILFTLGCNDKELGPRQKILSQDTCEGTKVEGRFLVKWYDGRITLETHKNEEEFIEEFLKKNLEQVEYAEHDRYVQFLPLETALQETQALTEADNWGINAVSAPAAWAQGIRGEGVLVAVIDTGVDTKHPQLIERIYENTGETGINDQGDDRRLNGIDDDENGFIDDYAGYDFVANSPHVSDWSGHGTHVAGIIAAEHYETSHVRGPVQGVAPLAKILPISFIGEFGGGHVADAISAIDFAVAHGAKIINASWGSEACSAALADRIAKLAVDDVLFVAAAGNSSSNLDIYPEYPAAYRFDSQITVGSITRFGGMAAHSNYSDTKVDLFAPGTNIVSTIPNNSTASLTGTSMAAPFVAGAAALLWGQNPAASSTTIKSMILSNTFQRADFRNLSSGWLNVGGSVESMSLMPSLSSDAPQ